MILNRVTTPVLDKANHPYTCITDVTFYLFYKKMPSLFCIFTCHKKVCWYCIFFSFLQNNEHYFIICN